MVGSLLATNEIDAAVSELKARAALGRGASPAGGSGARPRRSKRGNGAPRSRRSASNRATRPREPCSARHSPGSRLAGRGRERHPAARRRGGGGRATSSEPPRTSGRFSRRFRPTRPRWRPWPSSAKRKATRTSRPRCASPWVGRRRGEASRARRCEHYRRALSADPRPRRGGRAAGGDRSGRGRGRAALLDGSGTSRRRAGRVSGSRGPRPLRADGQRNRAPPGARASSTRTRSPRASVSLELLVELPEPDGAPGGGRARRCLPRAGERGHGGGHRGAVRGHARLRRGEARTRRARDCPGRAGGADRVRRVRDRRPRAPAGRAADAGLRHLRGVGGARVPVASTARRAAAGAAGPRLTPYTAGDSRLRSSHARARLPDRGDDAASGRRSAARRPGPRAPRWTTRTSSPTSSSSSTSPRSSRRSSPTKQAPPADGPALGEPQGEASLEEIFREFKKGVEQQLSAEDYETHYNLGIAYKEMGLVDEAIGEFQLASKDAAPGGRVLQPARPLLPREGNAAARDQVVPQGSREPRHPGRVRLRGTSLRPRPRVSGHGRREPGVPDVPRGVRDQLELPGRRRARPAPRGSEEELARVGPRSSSPEPGAPLPEPPRAPILAVQDLRVGVPAGRAFAPAVDGVSFHLAAGESLGGRRRERLREDASRPRAPRAVAGRVARLRIDSSGGPRARRRAPRSELAAASGGARSGSSFRNRGPRSIPCWTIGAQILEAILAHDERRGAARRGRSPSSASRGRIPRPEAGAGGIPPPPLRRNETARVPRDRAGAPIRRSSSPTSRRPRSTRPWRPRFSSSSTGCARSGASRCSSSAHDLGRRGASRGPSARPLRRPGRRGGADRRVLPRAPPPVHARVARVGPASRDDRAARRPRGLPRDSRDRSRPRLPARRELCASRPVARTGSSPASRREPELYPVGGSVARCFLYESVGDVGERGRRGRAEPLLSARDLEKRYPVRRGRIRHGPAPSRPSTECRSTSAAARSSVSSASRAAARRTTGRILLRLEEPTRGAVRFDGEDWLALEGEDLRRRRRGTSRSSSRIRRRR